MKHYKPRYVIEVDSVRGDMDSPRQVRHEKDHLAWVLKEVEFIDQFRNVYLRDRANQTSRKAETLYYGAGYYGLPYRGKTLEGLAHYLRGKIDRMADIAMDNLERAA